ncbi:ribokinase [Rhizobium calliandrae]|uniref:Ribokinase n=1 Tax=Rhizobium calliandrae TaxID=1312182 RepID=A0ABT7KB05_9HYPH|nr:ribokinase [Rhizobium calliandrae]MDL2405804.1 ribokinase [Rhizobium calliandrae]
MPVHVVGNVCVDTTFRVDRFPQPGETFNARSHMDGVGGKGANQAVAAARTGADVRFFAAVGTDPAAAFIRERLKNEFDLRQLSAKPLPSDRSTILVNQDGENLIVSGIDCAADFDPLRETGLLNLIAHGDILVMQGNLKSTVTNACLRAAKAASATTILNPSPLSGEALDLAAVDVVIVNQGEAFETTGKPDPEDAARDLVRRGAKAAIVTLGAAGCLLLEDGAVDLIPAVKVAVVDTSGAGDIFCGCLAGCLMKGWRLAQSARTAVAAAALAVGRRGTLEACPSRVELEKLMNTVEAESL